MQTHLNNTSNAVRDLAMHIILTHEQADFDALASLLGGYLLAETAIAVLPRRMNRNVNAFVTLYGVELPFVDPRDLPSEPVEKVTLVDTQSIISIKGMGPHTQVQVIDHHPLRQDLPEGWKVTTEDTGATATLFVEGIQERNGILGPIQATLLLLGIYEDTGSLTYTRTTPRDLNAAAFLLEHGASLEIANDFLNHPLSAQQQALYDRLREAAKAHHINGHTVVIASGDAQDIDEELSTVAHKMRDILDPDALFILLTTRGGVQLIARSTSDNIDVAQIADHFGGGGHERAAASLIKEKNLKQVCDELEKILPSYIQPAITVAQIMSRGPQLLSPETTVDEAARRMQRYGYEGYPVVLDGKVIGLLTRRAVDRALSHKLNLTADKLMEAGEYSVNPGDSIEKLQYLMTESGWGQIPVVNPEAGDVIGIVTRTDVLKTLTKEPKIPSRQNIAGRLESILPEARLVLLEAVAQAAHQQRDALYIVGGFVRDLLLDRPSQDFDLVVEGDAIELASVLAKRYGGRVTSHARFGTAQWHIGEIHAALLESLDAPNALPKNLPETLDLVTARTEFYTYPTALPTVERGSIKLDLHRRDFTINTLALRLDGRHYGELHDYWGGLNDLRHGLVRVLHSLSFVDDPTRMLRAVRFEQRFGFQIEERTLELLKEARPLLHRVSGDRIRHELNHILDEECNYAILNRLQELDLLSIIHQDLIWDQWLCDNFKRAEKAVPETYWDLVQPTRGLSLKSRLCYILWLIRLSSSASKNVTSRLKIPHNLTQDILSARRIKLDLTKVKMESPSQVVSRLDEYSSLAIYANYLICEDKQVREILKTYTIDWKHVFPRIDGHDLRDLGLPPGPIYRKILTDLRSAWLDGKITTKEQEITFLQDMISNYNKKDLT